jgi:hypothetical protein
MAYSKYNQERPFDCQHCDSHFKNKGNAARHNITVHNKNCWWSCDPLADGSSAFHLSPTDPSGVDICSYCGMAFLVSANQGVGDEHLNIYRYDDCNPIKSSTASIIFKITYGRFFSYP